MQSVDLHALDSSCCPDEHELALEWYRSAPVQHAVKAVGDYQDTDEWRHGFAKAILAYVDWKSELDTDELTQLVVTWDWHLNEHASTKGIYNNGHHTSGTGRPERNFWVGMPKEIPERLLSSTVMGRRMTFENCAWLLRVTANNLECVMWPKTNRQHLHAAADWVLADQHHTVGAAARLFHVSDNTLGAFMRYRYGSEVAAPILRRGSCLLSEADFQTAVGWMDEFGWDYRTAHAHLVRIGMADERYKLNSFYQRLRRSEALSAAAVQGPSDLVAA